MIVKDVAKNGDAKWRKIVTAVELESSGRIRKYVCLV